MLIGQISRAFPIVKTFVRGTLITTNCIRLTRTYHLVFINLFVFVDTSDTREPRAMAKIQQNTAEGARCIHPTEPSRRRSIPSPYPPLHILVHYTTMPSEKSLLFGTHGNLKHSRIPSRTLKHQKGYKEHLLLPTSSLRDILTVVLPSSSLCH